MALRRVELLPRPFADYRGVIEDDLYQQVEDLKASLSGFHVIEVNATPTGGGVAEMLQSEIPLLLDLGLDAEWWVIADAEPAFFDLTKKLHNLLQGQEGSLSQAEKDLYLRHAERFARDLRGLTPDFWLIHDPQPLAVARYLDDAIPRAWRSHIDTSHPNPAAMDFLLPNMEMYDWTIFSLREYAPPALQGDNLLVFKPAIDPLAPKNLPLAPAAADAILRGLGIDPSRPLMVQVSRFDPWKDPIGVVDAYRLAKKEVYDLQLAMVGVFSAKDDPEGPRIYAEVAHYTGPDPDVHLYTDPAQVGVELRLNGIQRLDDLDRWRRQWPYPYQPATCFERLGGLRRHMLHLRRR
jgi:trehalose synthase